ncbi:MAG: alpha/beta hydrolase [Kibdelosporangium sp.]
MRGGRVAATKFLERPGGRLAYDLRGHGPLVVCSPGMGDLRCAYTELADLLVAAGFTVVTMDLRGLGESSAHWPSYTKADTASDLVELLQELARGPAILVGNDYSAGASVMAAVTRSDLVAGVVLSGQWMRDRPSNIISTVGRWLISRRGIGRLLWNRAWPWLFGPQKPAGFPARQSMVAANLAQPGRYEAVRAMLWPGHQAAEVAMPYVTCPALVVMGDADPAFTTISPEQEAPWIAKRLGGPTDVLLIPGVGYYPHAERPANFAALFQRWWTTNHQLKLLGNN